MGSPPALHLANGWLGQFESTIRDDILRNIKTNAIEHKLAEINSLHTNLEFTYETEVNHRLAYIGMDVIHDPETGKLTSTWYIKPTDKGLILNYHSLAPKRAVWFCAQNLQLLQHMAKLPH